MKVHFSTNLDLAQSFVHYQITRNYGVDGCSSYHWTSPPPVGSRLRFSLKEYGDPGGFFELEVCGISYSADGATAWVDLHMPSYYSNMSIGEWEKWLKKRMGKDI